jgi:hypothetical protein
MRCNDNRFNKYYKKSNPLGSAIRATVPILGAQVLPTYVAHPRALPRRSAARLACMGERQVHVRRWTRPVTGADVNAIAAEV